jgi:hypothetical protein
MQPEQDAVLRRNTAAAKLTVFAMPPTTVPAGAGA